MKRENGEHWALFVHCLSLLRHYFGVTPDHCHRGLREKMVTDRKAKPKKQRQL